jgi:hypothetical protein
VGPARRSRDPGRLRRYASRVALLAAVTFVIVPAVARASAQWSAPIPVDSSPLVSVSCPSDSFCVAVDSAGNALTFDGAGWSAPSRIDGTVPLSSVSCPSASFCVAVDSAGNALTFDGTAWSAPASIDPTHSLTSVSCASASFCVAVDNYGSAVTDRDGTAWSAPASIDPTHSLTSVSCASASFCVAVDNSGNAVTDTGGMWSAPASIDPTHSLSSVSCPSSSFCLAVDVDSYFVTYEAGAWSPPVGLVIAQLSSVSCPSISFCTAVNNGYGWAPTYDGSTWGPNPMTSLEIGAGLRSVSCASAVFCATVDDAGEAFIYSTPPPLPVSTSPPVISGSAVQGALFTETHGSWTHSPTSFSYQWEKCDTSGGACSAIPDATSQAYLVSGSDVGHTIRVEEVATNVSGSSPPATSAATAVVVPSPGAALSRVLVPTGSDARIGLLLRHGGYSVVFDCPSAGRLAISWYLEPRGARVKQLLLIAQLRMSVQPAGARTVKITLTRRYRHLLVHWQRSTVIAKGTFIPSGQPATTVTKRFILRR